MPLKTKKTHRRARKWPSAATYDAEAAYAAAGSGSKSAGGPKNAVAFENKKQARLLVDAELVASDNVNSAMRRIGALERSIGSAPVSDHGDISSELARWRAKLAEAQQKHRAAADMMARINHFLTALGDVVLTDAKTKPVKGEKGETLTLLAGRIRTRIATLSAERRKVANCGLPIAEAKKQAEQLVAELVKRGRPKLQFGHDRMLAAHFNATVDGAFTVKPDIGAALAWLDEAAFLKRLIAEIEAQPKPAMALSANERSEKLAALDAELLVLEFER